MLLSQPVDNAALEESDPEAWLVTSRLDLPDGAGRLVVDRDRRGESLVTQDDSHFLVLGCDAPLNPHATLELSSPAAGVPLLGGRTFPIQPVPISIPPDAAGGAVRGVVIGPSGVAVPGAVVELYESDSVESGLDGASWVLHRVDRVTADASGAFVLDAVRVRDASVPPERATFLLRALDPVSGHDGRAISRLTLPGSVRVVNVVVHRARQRALLLHSPAFEKPLIARVRPHVVVDVVEKRLVRVGSDLAFGLQTGTCSKEGQDVPVNDGCPTMKISRMTVGGRR